MKLTASAIIAAGPDGKFVVTEGNLPGAPATALAGIAGGLVGLLAGPFGVAMGAAAGALSGGWFDINRAGEREQLSRSVEGKLREGHAALLAEIVNPQDDAKALFAERMAALGGSLIR